MKILTALILIVSFFSIVYPVLATDPPPLTIEQKNKNAGVQVGGKNTGELVGTAISNTILTLFTVGGIAFVLYFIWGSVEWILSGGDKEKIAEARKRITTAIIGLILLGLSFVIIGVVGQIAGFDLLSSFTGGLSIPKLGGP